MARRFTASRPTVTRAPVARPAVTPTAATSTVTSQAQVTAPVAQTLAALAPSVATSHQDGLTISLASLGSGGGSSGFKMPSVATTAALAQAPNSLLTSAQQSLLGLNHDSANAAIAANQAAATQAAQAAAATPAATPDAQSAQAPAQVPTQSNSDPSSGGGSSGGGGDSGGGGGNDSGGGGGYSGGGASDDGDDSDDSDDDADVGLDEGFYGGEESSVPMHPDEAHAKLAALANPAVPALIVDEKLDLTSHALKYAAIGVGAVVVGFVALHALGQRAPSRRIRYVR